jgi:hypothetical protein
MMMMMIMMMVIIIIIIIIIIIMYAQIRLYEHLNSCRRLHLTPILKSTIP